MLRFTLPALMRPRHIMFTPPPLSRRSGKFRCRVCQATWTSQNVWVTKTTERPYQGESCERCGTTVKPFYVGYREATMFNRAPMHDVQRSKSKSRRFDWRVGKGRR
eukprot:gene6142-4421_t